MELPTLQGAPTYDFAKNSMTLKGIWEGGVQNFTMKIRHHITRNNRKTGVNVVALVNRFKHYYQQSEYKCECCSFSE